MNALSLLAAVVDRLVPPVAPAEVDFISAPPEVTFPTLLFRARRGPVDHIVIVPLAEGSRDE